MVRAEKLFTDGVENLPPVQEIDRRFDHAQRWTPGEMQERIDELERRMRVAQPVVWDVDD